MHLPPFGTDGGSERGSDLVMPSEPFQPPGLNQINIVLLEISWPAEANSPLLVEKWLKFQA